MKKRWLIFGAGVAAAAVLAAWLLMPRQLPRAYREILQNDQRTQNSAYLLTDLDGDGRQELLLSEDDFHAAGVDIYRLVKGKAVMLGTVGSSGDCLYSEEAHLILSGFTGGGGETVCWLRLDKGADAFVTVAYYQKHLDFQTGEEVLDVMEIDGRAVTETDWDEAGWNTKELTRFRELAQPLAEENEND